MIAYVICKAAIDALTRIASQELGQYGITTIVFLPIVVYELAHTSERGRAHINLLVKLTDRLSPSVVVKSLLPNWSVIEDTQEVIKSDLLFLYSLIRVK
ncbi:hypothetical protein [Cytobacillus firmus]|uniref:hypothetical protein n=1 Tax=Cytobacillus firmus TaxID=1399 RepID=UPI0022280F47|nr:hypothetical protein [Cytobacillus firmus]